MPVIRNEQVAVSTHDRDEQGKQIDAEERPAEIQQEAAIPVFCGQAPGGSPLEVGALRNGSGVAINGTAVEIASGMAHQCYLCANFDQHAFKLWKAANELSPDLRKRAEVDFLRAELLGNSHRDYCNTTGPDGDIDVEAILMSECGMCRAMPEIIGDQVVVFKNSGCPTYRGPKGEDLTKCFRPKDRESLKESDQIRDSILQTAQGQIKRRATYRVPLHILKPKKETP